MAFGMLLHHNVIFLLTGIGTLVVIPNSAMAQVNNNNSSGWTTYTLEKCKVSFECNRWFKNIVRLEMHTGCYCIPKPIV